MDFREFTKEKELILSCRLNHEDIAMCLLRTDGHKIDVDESDDFSHEYVIRDDEKGHGKTALMWACSNGNLTLVKALIEIGADVNEQDKKGMTPLHYACRNGNIEVVEYLLEQYANPNIKDEKSNCAYAYVEGDFQKKIRNILMLNIARNNIIENENYHF